jgi:hypothetical protein
MPAIGVMIFSILMAAAERGTIQVYPGISENSFKVLELEDFMLDSSRGIA